MKATTDTESMKPAYFTLKENNLIRKYTLYKTQKKPSSQKINTWVVAMLCACGAEEHSCNVRCLQ